MHRNEKNISAQKENRCAPHLHHWYVDWKNRRDGTKCAIAHGTVTGHQILQDTMHIHTSKIEEIKVDQKTEEAIIQTLNTEYHCRLSDCDFSKTSTYEFIPELMDYAKMYKKEKEYIQEDNSILLILSDHEQYYFESMRLKKDGKSWEGRMYPHVGTFQDSCLIGCTVGKTHIDIRYFPHNKHLETYCWETAGLPVYLENCGEGTIYYTTEEGVMELKSGQRKLVSKENVMAKDEITILDRSDL